MSDFAEGYAVGQSNGPTEPIPMDSAEAAAGFGSSSFSPFSDLAAGAATEIKAR